MNVVHMPPRIFGIVRELFPPIGIVSPTGEITFNDDTQELPSLPDVLEDEQAPFPPPKEGDFEKGYLTCWGDLSSTVFRRFIFGDWVYCRHEGKSYIKIRENDASTIIFVPIAPNQYPTAYEACQKAFAKFFYQSALVEG